MSKSSLRTRRSSAATDVPTVIQWCLGLPTVSDRQTMPIWPFTTRAWRRVAMGLWGNYRQHHPGSALGRWTAGLWRLILVAAIANLALMVHLVRPRVQSWLADRVGMDQPAWPDWLARSTPWLADGALLALTGAVAMFLLASLLIAMPSSHRFRRCFWLLDRGLSPLLTVVQGAVIVWLWGAIVGYWPNRPTVMTATMVSTVLGVVYLGSALVLSTGETWLPEQARRRLSRYSRLFNAPLGLITGTALAGISLIVAHALGMTAGREPDQAIGLAWRQWLDSLARFFNPSSGISTGAGVAAREFTDRS
ncbi:MAG: hypothetical protein LBV30_03535, partial [Propionibacteriaceae bacterium]|nr:hypothetical protein [Propionibacteriaceae bacterium]